MKVQPKSRSLSYDEAYELIGGLSTPSKMPWYGWSTPAKACLTGSKLRSAPNSVCSACYAFKGHYAFSNVQNAQERRLKAITHPRFVEAFVIVLKRLYKNGHRTYLQDGVVRKENRFRWHDSGDLQSLEHLRMINAIALACPEIDFWLPTREVKFVKQHGPFAPNLFVKISFPMIGGKFAGTDQTFAQSTVGRDDDPDIYQCPALKLQNNKCLDCRACWSNADVNYPLH